MRRILWLIAIVSLGSMVSVGCDDDLGGKITSTGGAPGKGGTGGGGAGGKGGVPGNGGTTAKGGASGSDGGGGTGATTVPPCVAAVGEKCPMTSTCTSYAPDPTNPSITNTCYDNGAKSCPSYDATAGTMSTLMYKADGTLCYTVSLAFTATGISMSWVSLAGTTVATGTGTFSSNVYSITCPSDGKTYSWDISTPGGPLQKCTSGTCSCTGPAGTGGTPGSGGAPGNGGAPGTGGISGHGGTSGAGGTTGVDGAVDGAIEDAPIHDDVPYSEVAPPPVDTGAIDGQAVDGTAIDSGID